MFCDALSAAHLNRESSGGNEGLGDVVLNHVEARLQKPCGTIQQPGCLLAVARRYDTLQNVEPHGEIQHTVQSLIHASELDTLAPLSWLIDGEIPEAGLSTLFGPSGGGKSFVALDYALRIAQRHNVIYIAAEGRSGYKKRRDAWCAYHQQDVGGLYFRFDAVNMLDANAVQSFIAAIEIRSPKLVVIDTLARCMLGGDENSARDMGLFINACDAIRKATGAAVLVVHHTGKGGDYRGSSALLGACDTMIELENKQRVITLKCVKTKDEAPFQAKQLRLLPVDESCVVVPTEEVRSVAGADLTKCEHQVLEFLCRSEVQETGAAGNTIAESTGVPIKSLYRTLQQLRETGYIQKGGKRDPYFITEKGKDVLVHQS